MAGEKILLVEDNPVNRRLAEFLLRSQGYRVREAPTAEEAFEILKTDRPDLILMDLQLPGMDGLRAVKQLKQDPAMQDIPVVAVTSYAMKGDRERAQEAGCSSYITKPIDKTTLLEEVASQLARSRRLSPAKGDL